MKTFLPKILMLIFSPFILNSAIAQWNTNKAINNTVVDTSFRQVLPKMCSDGAGGVIIAWWDDRDNNTQYDVMLQRLDSNGVAKWTKNGISLNTFSSGFGDMDIVADGNGGAVVAFIAGAGSLLDIKAQRVNALGQKMWNSGNPVTICNAANAQFSVNAVSDGDGSSVIVWEDERAGTSADDIYAQRLNSSGVPQWTANGSVVNAAVNVQEVPKAVADGAGGVIVTWRDFRGGSNYDIYTQHLDNTGTRVWTITGVVVSTAVNNQNFPQICTDGSHGAIIAWQDFRNGSNTDIYAQRINNAGTAMWTANGQVLCNTSNVQEIKDIAFTGDGAAVVWIDYPAGGSDTAYNLFAQKINLAGAIKWVTNGAVVCNAAGQQNNCDIEGDGSNGAVFVWTDQRLGISDLNIYAQRLDTAGKALWSTNGEIICNATGFQVGPHVINHNCTNIFCWDDQRNGAGQDDVFATAIVCAAPSLGLTAVNIKAISAQLKWTTISCAAGYRVQYRVNGTTAWTTKAINTNTGSATITGLTANTTYQWHVGTKCKSGATINYSAYSKLKTFTTSASFANDISLSELMENDNKELLVYPNPAKNEAHVVFNAQKAGNYILELTDISGKILFRKTAISAAGKNNISIAISSFARGIYFVSVSNDGDGKRWMKLNKE